MFLQSASLCGLLAEERVGQENCNSNDRQKHKSNSDSPFVQVVNIAPTAHRCKYKVQRGWLFPCVINYFLTFNFF